VTQPPLRLTYLILDGNKTEALRRINLQNDYELIVLDLKESLKEKNGWGRNSQITLYKVDLTGSSATQLLNSHPAVPIRYTPLNPLSRLYDSWAYSPDANKVHLLVEVSSG
jgi:hypothetical protein